MKTAVGVDPVTSPALGLEPAGLLAGLGEKPDTFYSRGWNQKRGRRELGEWPGCPLLRASYGP